MLNQVSFKDLFSTNPGQLVRRCHDSDNGSQNNSQYPYSQLDFPDSQDFNSSQHTSSQVSQKSDSPGKKFYQRYVSKGPLLKRDNLSNKATNLTSSNASSTANKLNFQHQLQVNKAKALDRDERDLLNTMLSSLRECTAEVKSAVDAVKLNIEEGATITEANLANYLEKIEKGLEQNKTGFMNAVSLRDNIHEEIAILKQQLSMKETTIKELRSELDKLKKKGDNDILDQLKEIKDTCNENQEHMNRTVQDMFEGRKSEIQKECKQLEKKHSDYAKMAEKSHQKLLEQHKLILREIESRICESLGSQEKQNGEIICNIRSNIAAFDAKLKKEISCMLQAQMEELCKHTTKNQSLVLERQTEALFDLLEKHKSSLHDFLTKLLSERGTADSRDLEYAVDKLYELDRQQALNAKAENLKRLQEKENYRREKELNELKRRHQEEVNRLLSEQQEALENNQPVTVSCFQSYSGSKDNTFSVNKDDMESVAVSRHTSQNLPLMEVGDGLSGGVQVQPYSSTRPISAPGVSSTFSVSNASFVSPILPTTNKWSSRFLFSRNNTKPSPVSAVLPQLAHKVPVNSNQVCKEDENLMNRDAEGGAGVDENTVRNNRRGRKRRKRSHFTHKRKRKNSAIDNPQGSKPDNSSDNTKEGVKNDSSCLHQRRSTPFSRRNGTKPPENVFEFHDDEAEPVNAPRPYACVSAAKRAEVKPFEYKSQVDRSRKHVSDDEWQAIRSMPNKPLMPLLGTSSYMEKHIVSPEPRIHNDPSSQDSDSSSFWSSPAMSVAELVIKTQATVPTEKVCDGSLNHEAVMPPATRSYLSNEGIGKTPTKPQHSIVSTQVVALRHTRHTPRTRFTRSQKYTR